METFDIGGDQKNVRTICKFLMQHMNSKCHMVATLIPHDSSVVFTWCAHCPSSNHLLPLQSNVLTTLDLKMCWRIWKVAEVAKLLDIQQIGHMCCNFEQVSYCFHIFYDCINRTLHSVTDLSILGAVYYVLAIVKHLLCKQLHINEVKCTTM